MTASSQGVGCGSHVLFPLVTEILITLYISLNSKKLHEIHYQSLNNTPFIVFFNYWHFN